VAEATCQPCGRTGRNLLIWPQNTNVAHDLFAPDSLNFNRRSPILVIETGDNDQPKGCALLISRSPSTGDRVAVGEAKRKDPVRKLHRVFLSLGRAAETNTHQSFNSCNARPPERQSFILPTLQQTLSAIVAIVPHSCGERWRRLIQSRQRGAISFQHGVYECLKSSEE
jgi:hypothetical protein